MTPAETAVIRVVFFAMTAYLCFWLAIRRADQSSPEFFARLAMIVLGSTFLHFCWSAIHQVIAFVRSYGR